MKQPQVLGMFGSMALAVTLPSSIYCASSAAQSSAAGELAACVDNTPHQEKFVTVATGILLVLTQGVHRVRPFKVPLHMAYDLEHDVSRCPGGANLHFGCQRVFTHGGLPPMVAPATPSDTARIPFEAEYILYRQSQH
jgi:hypothetical protein